MALVLLADDDLGFREEAEAALRAAGHQVTVISDVTEAAERFARGGHQLAILSLGALGPLGPAGASGLPGIAACRRIKAERGQRVPVVLTGADADLPARLLALAVADDFVPRATEIAELCARVEARLRTRRLIEEAEVHIELTPAAPEPAAVAEVAAPPALAGLLERPAFVARLDEEWRRAARAAEPLSLMVVGVDGPPAEAALPALFAALERGLRPVDAWGRTDRSHVAALLRGTHLTGMMTAVAGLRAELRRFTFEGRAVTASVGAAFHPSREVAGPADLMTLAERALARAREEGPGKNCFWQHAGYLFEPPDLP